MKRSICLCGVSAAYSICVLVSSLGVSPRRQKCGVARPFCAACIQKLFSERWLDQARNVQESLREAYTEVAEQLRAESHPQLASKPGIDQQHEMFMGQEV
jgi:hypothetical protein